MKTNENGANSVNSVSLGGSEFLNLEPAPKPAHELEIY